MRQPYLEATMGLGTEKVLAAIYDVAHTATVNELNGNMDYQRHRQLADEYVMHEAFKEMEQHLLAMADMYTARFGNNVNKDALREAISRLSRSNE